MKKILYFLLVSFALIVSSLGLHAETVTVTSNYSSGIENANLIATLDDGSILGFNGYWSDVYFCGAISKSTSLTIPDSVSFDSHTAAVKYIGYNRCDFDNANSVTSLTLPATTPSILYFPSTVKILHTKDYIEYFNVDQISNLTKLFVPEETIDLYYENYSWRKNVLINAEGSEPLKITINMTKPGEFAQLLLQQTNNWYKVNELTVIGKMNEDDLNVFKRMEQLIKLDLSQSIISDIPNNFGYDNNYNNGAFGILEEIILPSIKTIGTNAFHNTHKLRKIIIPHVESIGDFAFYESSLPSIELPNELCTIGQYVFYNCNLESIKIPSSVTEISNNCFQYCSNLKSINIPASVTKIGYESFRGSGLTSVNLPGVKSIGDCAFYNCEDLAEVKFSEGLTSLGYSSFYFCTSLTEIDLPSTSLSFNYAPFYGCTNIKKVTCRAVMPPIHNNNSSILDNCDMTNVKLYVPAMSIDKYRADSGWKSFYTILPMEDKISKAYIYDNFTFDDASQFTNDCIFTIGWYFNNTNYQYYCGAVDYNGNTTFSMQDYKQYHSLGYSGYNNTYQDAYFTSLISNGTMRADNVQTTLRTNSTSVWYFISLPYDVKVSDITYTDGTPFVIRKYSGLNRAEQSGNTWQNLTNEDIMHAYEGYILRCNKNEAEFTFPAINNSNKNKVFEKENVSVPLGDYPSEFEHNRSWNLIGNPYPCYYDTRYMDFTAPITVWNNYYNRYDAYSPVDDSYILHPTQSFFVQCPVGQTSLIFDKSGRQKDATARTYPANTPRRKVSDLASREVYNVILSDGTNEDHTRFVINDKAKCNYELDKDASKFMSDDNASILLYSIENGVKYAINERPMESGSIRLGFYVPKEGEYSLSLNSSQMNNLILIDSENNTEKTFSSDYKFYATAGFNDTRFSLIFGEATGIISLDRNNAQINVENGIVSANTFYSIYSINGQFIGNFNAGVTTELPKGAYVIQCKDSKRKIVVK